MSAKAGKKGLGRGLEALLGDVNVSVDQLAQIGEKPSEHPLQGEEGAEGLRRGEQYVAIGDIDPNPGQPRKDFDEEKLQGLANSIDVSGIIQPLIVRENGRRYTLVAGERRWRAARLAGLKQVPVLVRDYSDAEIMEVALVENLQRSDLNPVEEAAGIQLLIQQHDLTQEEVAARLGMSRPAVTNSLRLLKLPEPVLAMLREGLLSSGHARAVAALPEAEVQIAAAEEIRDKGLSVRQAEQLCRMLLQEPGREKPEEKAIPIDPDIGAAQEQLQSRFGTKVAIKGSLDRGSIRIDYYSKEQLEGIYAMLNGED